MAIEKKRKNMNNNKLTQSSQGGETTNHLLSKDNQAQNGVNLPRKNLKISSPSHDNVSSETQQCTPVFQWPYTQPVRKQPPTVTPNHMKPSPFIKQQTPQYQQQYHSHNGSSPSEVAQSTGSFWLPPGPGPGFLALGATTTQSWQTPQPWQTPIGALSRPEHHNPGFYYQGGHSHPMGYPGTWNPSSWWGPQCSYSFPGPYGFFPFAPPLTSDSSLLLGQNQQRGIIQIEENMSRKHQKMWQTQSLENIHLWAVIGQLRAELGVYGSRLMKLEAEVSSLTSRADQGTGFGASPAAGTGGGSSSGIAIIGQTLKRGRPKKVAPTTVSPYADESQPRTCGRKPALNKTLFDSSKEGPDMEKENAYQPEVGKSNAQQVSGTLSDGVKSNGLVSHLNGSNIKMSQEIQPTSISHNQIPQDSSKIPAILNRSTSTGIQGKDKNLSDRTMAFPVLCDPFKGAELETTSNNGTTNTANHGWGSNLLSDECGRNFLDNRSQAFYSNVHVIRQRGKVIPGWSFMNGNATEEHEDVVVESGKDDNNEELEDANSGANETTLVKVEGSYEMNSSAGTKFWLS